MNLSYRNVKNGNIRSITSVNHFGGTFCIEGIIIINVVIVVIVAIFVVLPPSEHGFLLPSSGLWLNEQTVMSTSVSSYGEEASKEC